MSTSTISPLLTDPAYASKEAQRTSRAYGDAREFQDVVHEMTICTFNRQDGPSCHSCLGCTFRAFLADHPKDALIVIKHAINELHDETSQLHLWYNLDLTGFGPHFAHNGTFDVECSRWDELGEKMANVPDEGNCYKARNEYIWEIYAELLHEEYSRA